MLYGVWREFGTERNVRQVDDVFTIGFPLGSLLGNSPRVSKGIINSLFGFDGEPRLLQMSAPVQPGNSGGPLFNTDGDVVGIVVST